jgi:hypothetical protein
MPPRKKPVRRKSVVAKAPARRRTRTKALAIGDAVRREAIGHSVLDRQLAVFEAMMAWSPARMLLNQQAAFWEGFAGPLEAQPARKRAPKRTAKTGKRR